MTPVRLMQDPSRVLQGYTCVFPSDVSVFLLPSVLLCSPCVMNSILQRAAAEGSSPSAGVVPVLKYLRSSSIKVSIVSSSWIRGKISFSGLLSELPPSVLSRLENISPLS